MKMHLKYLLIQFAFLLCGTAVLAAERIYAHSDSKEIVRTFPVSSASTVEIRNKYGPVHIETWEKDSVRFEVLIEAQAGKPEHVELLLRMAEIDFLAAGDHVVADLAWGRSVNMIRRNAVDVMLNLSSEQVLVIGYRVWMPADLTLNIENRFGNVYLPEMTGKIYLTVHHGDVRARELKEVRKLLVKYGKLDIDRIDKGSLDLSFVTGTLEKSGDIHLQSSGSTLIAGEIKNLTLKSTNDKIDIEYLRQLSGSSSLSHIRVRECEGSVVLNARFGSVTLRRIRHGFGSIRIDGSNTDLNLSFQQDPAFSFRVILENGKTFLYPPGIFTVTSDEKADRKQSTEGQTVKSPGTQRVEVAVRNAVVKFDVIP